MGPHRIFVSEVIHEMGCTFSKSESQLGRISPWDYTVNGQVTPIDEAEWKRIREVIVRATADS